MCLMVCCKGTVEQLVLPGQVSETVGQTLNLKPSQTHTESKRIVSESTRNPCWGYCLTGAELGFGLRFCFAMLYVWQPLPDTFPYLKQPPLSCQCRFSSSCRWIVGAMRCKFILGETLSLSYCYLVGTKE